MDFAYEWRTKSLTTRDGHGQSGWSCMGCEGFRTDFNIPSPLPATLAFRKNFVACPDVSYISHDFPHCFEMFMPGMPAPGEWHQGVARPRSGTAAPWLMAATWLVRKLIGKYGKTWEIPEKI